ncbi:hypothetical protein CcI49_10275 [Frankia sp. CcI49]|uniref:hypothetical protein n=1 Tax=unclassified Frankia TaxID=2632575 RepID=UPI0006CA2343|nr:MULTISPECIES: hypothetical protein [unclassified Frankia]KPM51100.1 hypothetical protein ACG83_37375 [Frankia sp. R43]ONH60679.1 hypothetical protein CcI49_10275 [Frankia sp. CcI49]
MSIDLELGLREAMRGATEPLTAGPDLAQAARERFRRRRRNRRAVLGAAMAVLVAVFSTGLVVARSGSDAVEIRPAGPSPAVTSPSPAPITDPLGLLSTRDVGGVDITWLPAGVVPGRGARSGWGEKQARTSRFDYPGAVDGQRGFVAVTTEWNPELTFDEVEIRMRAQQRRFERVTVRGRPALLTHQNDPALLTQLDVKEVFSLVWIEQDGLCLEVAARAPATESDIRRVADGLVVGSPPRTDPADDRAIRAVVAQAFSTTTPPDRVLAAVENGADLASGLALYRSQHPGLARTLRVAVNVVDAVVMVPGRAGATITLTFTDPTVRMPDALGGPEGPTTRDTMVMLVRTGKGWQVGRDSFCALLQGVCPAG